MKLKMFILISVLFTQQAFAADNLAAWDLLGDMQARATLCASNDGEKANIAKVLKKVSLFGTWKATINGKNAVAVLSKDSAGNYKGSATYDGSSYGPYTIKICDNGSYFYGEVFGYEARFDVISKTKIKIYSPLDPNETIIAKK